MMSGNGPVRGLLGEKNYDEHLYTHRPKGTPRPCRMGRRRVHGAVGPAAGKLGHLLLVPKQQVESIYQLPDEAYYRLWQIVRFLEAPLRRAIDAPRIGLAFEGFGVPHAHLHLIPVYRRGDLDPRRAKPAAFEDLRPIAERIRNEIAGEPELSLGM